MKMYYIFSFVVGGFLTVSLAYCEGHGFYLLSRVIVLFPLLTWISYYFLGAIPISAIQDHTLFLVLGNLFAWVPSMLFIYFTVSKYGVTKTIYNAILIFLVLAAIFALLYKRKGL